MPTYPGTPDGRYFVVKGQLWRCSNPSLAEELRQQLVSELMSAHRTSIGIKSRTALISNGTKPCHPCRPRKSVEPRDSSCV